VSNTIDFDAVARRIVELTDLRLIREQLLLVWSARGAADTAKVESELAAMMGASASGPYHQESRSRCAHWTRDRPERRANSLRNRAGADAS
jgi:hypothetical protein